MSVVVEPVTGHSEHIAMAISYEELRPEKGKINICLKNHSARQVTLPRQTTVGESMPANMIPALSNQKPTGFEEHKKGTTTKKKKNEGKKELLDEIDLARLEEWGRDGQKEAWDLITEYKVSLL